MKNKPNKTDFRPYEAEEQFRKRYLLCRTPDGRSFLVEMQKAARSDQRDRLFYYGARLLGSQVKPGGGKYNLSPVKVICIMNYEDRHPDSPNDKILYQYRTVEWRPESRSATRFPSISLSFRG